MQQGEIAQQDPGGPPKLPRVLVLGDNKTRLWGLEPIERTRRIAAKEKLALADGAGSSPLLLINSQYAFDPLWLAFMKERPGCVLTIGGAPAIAHVTHDVQAAAAAITQGRVPGGLEVVPAEEHRNFYNKALRKLEWPFLVRLTPEAVPEIERRSYYGAYKGVTDILTKYLWPEWALVLTRLCARFGITPNMVTAVGAAACVLATILFWQGRYWTGMGVGLLFMVLDTVDGKLARCTITSSKIGNILDHGIDQIHPPFWWYAWAVGLIYWGRPLEPAAFTLVMAIILGGYVLQRVVEGAFMRIFGMHIHVWERIDSKFRLITARRNPNMVILFVSVVVGRPDTGLWAVAAWTAISTLFHAMRLWQAMQFARRGGEIRSWLE